MTKNLSSGHISVDDGRKVNGEVEESDITGGFMSLERVKQMLVVQQNRGLWIPSAGPRLQCPAVVMIHHQLTLVMNLPARQQYLDWKSGQVPVNDQAAVAGA